MTNQSRIATADDIGQFVACSSVVDGKWGRSYKAVCGRCNADATVPMNTVRASGQGADDKVYRMLSRKFTALGWIITRRQQADRCPECAALQDNRLRSKFRVVGDRPLAAALTPVVEEIKPAPAPAPQIQQEVSLKTIARPAVVAPQLKTGEMTKLDKRTIIAKLEEVYDSDRSCYRKEWSDQKTAIDMGVEIGWISTVRVELFGPAISPELSKVVEGAKDLIAESKDILTKIERARAAYDTQVAPLLDRLEKVRALSAATQRQLDAIERAIGA